MDETKFVGKLATRANTILIEIPIRSKMRKGPKENGENPSSEKTGKTTNTENIIEDACELHF